MLVFDPVDDLHLQAISEQRRGIAKMWGRSWSRGMLWQFVHVGDFIFQYDPCQLFPVGCDIGRSEINFATQ